METVKNSCLALNSDCLPEHRRGTCHHALKISRTSEQWVKNIKAFSTQYSTGGSWSGSCVEGPPRVYPKYGDISEAWAPKVCDANQYLECEYEHEVTVSQIDIYETYMCGGIVKVSGRPESSDDWTTLWEAEGGPQLITKSRIFSPMIKPPSEFQMKFLRLNIDCTACNSWVEIDAIKLTGFKPKPLQQPTLSLLSDALSELLSTGIHSDMSLYIENDIFKVHKAILAVRCPTLLRTLQIRATGNPDHVNVTDMSREVLGTVLQYVYTGQLGASVTPYDMAHTIKICNDAELPDLKLVCIQHLEKEISTNNVVDIYEIAHNDDSLGEVGIICVNYVSKHMKEVTHTKAFSALSKDVMLGLVQSASTKSKD